MGTDFQRTVLWVFFGMSLFLLWDRWLVYSGKPSMFGTVSAPQQTVPAPASTTPAAPATPSAVPSAVPAPGPAPVAVKGIVLV